MGVFDRLFTGKKGEDEAGRVLKKNGYRIIEKNFRCPYGEIDIIAKDRDTIVFIEVKTRTTGGFGAPKESVDSRKQRHMTAAAQAYLLKHNLEDHNARFDVVSIIIKDNKTTTEIIKNAFDIEG